jgi:hypothetical protein
MFNFKLKLSNELDQNVLKLTCYTGFNNNVI